MKVTTKLLLVLLSLGFVGNAHAQSKVVKKKVIRKAKVKDAKGKVDISDLENKYWSAKDTDFSVVQNRTFTKEGKFLLTLGAGPILNDQWSTGLGYSLGLSYFFSERMGLELSYTGASLSDNDAVTGFQEDLNTAASPNHGRLTSQIGLAFNYIPFYAKMSFLGKKIMYLDIGVSPGIALVSYDQLFDADPATAGFQETERGESTIGLKFDITQYIFVSKSLAFRLDLKNIWFKEDIVAFGSGQGGGAVAPGTVIDDQVTHLLSVLFGVTLYF